MEGKFDNKVGKMARIWKMNLAFYGKIEILWSKK